MKVKKALTILICTVIGVSLIFKAIPHNCKTEKNVV